MKGYRFRPQLIPALFCGALFALLVGLGSWQCQRAAEKEALLARMFAAEHGTFGLEEIMAMDKDAQGLAVQLHGHFDHRVILLDNQPQGQRPGMHVLSALRASSGQWLLVNRGWLPWDAERRMPHLPDLLHGEMLISGDVHYPSDKQVVLKDDDFSNPQWPLLVQKLDLARLSKVLGVELAPFVVRLVDGENVERGAPLLREWPAINMSPEKHRAYSFQWFAMASALLILFIIFSMEKTISHEPES